MKLADKTLLKNQCLIDGQWVGEGVDPIHNPATGELIARVPSFGHAEAVRAVEAAERASALGQDAPPSSAPRSCADGSI